MNSDLKFFLVGIVGGIITLFLPVLLWNVWFLDYINSHGKLVAFLCAPVFAGISAAIFAGAYNARKSLTGIGREGHQVNPFWGWFAVALVVELIFVLISNG
jgi:cobalamin synthase